ncbi:MAG: hypothetical protein B7X59_01085 [Polaromonas sp. 39-63-203]|jgi:cytoskeleton protein RodZ|uniref:helix-turn-helix domain-containing protein n=1 Tax=Polaromonas sp. TaxID=1869339 RepID=UPI000BC44C02|nr:RodZ domain-containing protein [Polaromonas sp.]OYY53059.1 MAG: hypothetical protein B7Y54_04525 [Polaromonas sp. 35-63-240]OYZ02810.1 MAG: hypothetical protein B7Y42_02135 [Polaromonas sp. 28-63-22]OYZ84948.1 MAG: hypothetical protein B7Y03_01405 [Polaromonas sp. 24-62-144]OZB02287.1 MAG: hypothetical protein B7X59_01085 [Polaromonas sp. 39-63-203]HQS30854.1 DUF4115 domain-containing protein [Polaromonas sp.]
MNELRYAEAANAGASGAVSGFGGLADADQGPSAGTLIRSAREAAGLHIAALAVSLKVPVKKLEALEQDRTDLLPDATFARALAASVCRSLKVDAAPVLARLPQARGTPLRAQSRHVPTPFRSPGERSISPLWSAMARPPVVGGVALLLGTLALVFWPAIREAGSRLAGRADTLAGPAEPSLSAPLILELTGPGAVSPGKAPTSPGAGAAEGAVTTPDAQPSVFSAPPGSASMLVAAPAQPTGERLAATDAPVAGTTSGIVTFSAKGASWVEVTDARGVVVLRRTLSAGEVVGASGAMPLHAVVGRADSTQVHVRGKSLDLTPLSRDNVARFEVK